MDNAIYVGLSRQIILERELDIAANNLANVDTVGFKFESMISNDDPVTMPTPGVAPTSVNFTADAGVARDFTQGSLTQTGAPLDVAIAGKGFFQINTPDGPRYTRDGRFDGHHALVDQDGDPTVRPCPTRRRARSPSGQRRGQPVGPGRARSRLQLEASRCRRTAPTSTATTPTSAEHRRQHAPGFPEQSNEPIGRSPG